MLRRASQCHASPWHALSCRSSGRPFCDVCPLRCVTLCCLRHGAAFGAFFWRCATTSRNSAASAAPALPSSHFASSVTGGRDGGRSSFLLFIVACFTALLRFAALLCGLLCFPALRCVSVGSPRYGLVLSACGRYDASSVCWAAGVWCWHPGLPSLLFPTFCLVVTSDY